MTERTHSLIGASSMHRWSKCPGSIRLGKGVANRSSSYAEEGTAAHAVAEKWLRTGGCPNDVDEETRDAVKIYVDAVKADFAADPRGGMLIEKSFNLSEVYPGAYGTADCVLYDSKAKLLRVYDYKHGAGVPVEVAHNPQLLYYALGALLETKLPAREVEIVVVQPRCPHPDGPVRRWRIAATDLVEFAAELVEYAKATEDPNAPLVPGDWCRFCPASGMCPAVKTAAQEKAKLEFRAGLSYDPKVLADTLAWLPILETWIKQTREFAYAEAEHGRTAPGWKLVEKRATRKWNSDDQTVLAVLKGRFGLKQDEVTELSVLSPAKVEKLIDADRRKDMEDIVSQESSGCTLAPESDKRPPVRRDAKSEFTAVTSP